MAKKRWVCVCFVCLETFSRPQQRRDITLEYLLHLGRGRSGANLTSRIAAHRWTHTHTHPIGKEERTHTEALAKTLNLFCFFVEAALDVAAPAGQAQSYIRTDGNPVSD